MANKLLNFRCPDELLAAIDEVGKQRYPNSNSDNGYDRTKTILDLLQAGIQALSDGTVFVTISKTESKTADKTVDSQQLKAELMTEVRQLLDDVRQEFDEKLLRALGELLA
ncbi:hypothetical protein NUACC21_74610 [Scytonema sp. NUACC21]